MPRPPLRPLLHHRATAPALLALPLLLFTLLAACESTSGLGGTIAIDGSSTVFPITEAMAEEFSLEHRGVRVTVGVSGTGGGFERFCAGEIDISDASRPIKPSEIEACAANGIDFVEIPVAFDGLSVVVNPENDFVDFLTVAELNAVWRPDHPVDRWSEIRPEWPDEGIDLFGPDVDSGTFDYFTEVINGEGGAVRADFTASADDNVLVIGVAGEEFGLGYFGFSFFINNADRLRAVPIDGGAGPVSPEPATINDGSYFPLSRPLFIYVAAASLDDPAVVQFIDFYLTIGRALVDSPEIGYVRLPDELYEVIRRRVAARLTGSPIAGATPQDDLIDLYSEGLPPARPALTAP